VYSNIKVEEVNFMIPILKNEQGGGRGWRGRTRKLGWRRV